MTDEMTVPKPPLTVVQFDAREAYPDVIALLEHLLERARSGEVIGVAAALLLRGQEMGTVFTIGTKQHIFTAIGGVEYLKQRMLQNAEEP